MTIPDAKIVAVQRALQETFGTTEFEQTGNLSRTNNSDPVFRIIVRGSPYLLRIIMRVDDPACHFSCMTAAAEAGAAPRVWYANIADKICIADFVESVPFPLTDALVRIPEVLRKLHALPPFPPRANHLNTSPTYLTNDGPARDQFLQMFRSAEILPRDEGEQFFAAYEKVLAAYHRDDLDMVSGHNDLKPDNMLFDGDRLWLVDWEAAFLNDRYCDLAVMANFAVSNEDEERIYLQQYFGQAPDEYQLARLYLMRQVVHMFYTMAYLWLGLRGSDTGGKPMENNETGAELDDLHRRLWAGELNLSDRQTKIAYGQANCKRLLHNIRQARFHHELKIVADRYAHAATGNVLN
jgi:aminoglycoside phosphotransferase (APT) family kinase protein